MIVIQFKLSGELQTNSLIDRYNRIFSTSPTSLYGSQFNFNYQYLRPQLYSEYDVMDQDAIIASALDIIADESTLKNDMGEVLSIRSSNEDIQKILYNLFYDVLNIEFNLWSWVRQMSKYGDFFLKLEISQKNLEYIMLYLIQLIILKDKKDTTQKTHLKSDIDIPLMV